MAGLDSPSNGAKEIESDLRLQIFVNGIVQGVGFRPFIYNIARSHHIAGFVTNTESGVEIQAEGEEQNVYAFLNSIKTDAPPLSIILEVKEIALPKQNDSDFVIKPSEKSDSVSTYIPPDTATCDDCIQDIKDPNNRRYRYPFTNCTNCGPRYTIIENLPYDRPETSMRSFQMCHDCQSEYDDPNDRRFHAQPNACPVCGPQISLWKDNGSQVSCHDPLNEAIQWLMDGKILAIKGLGGFHLAVHAGNEDAIVTQRERKMREEKPFAIMVRDIETAQTYATVSDAELALLLSPRRPIVLLQKKNPFNLAHSIAPGNDRIGIMLPYTPLHHLLFSESIDALVMTSANLSEEPICIHNDETFRRLESIADAYLIHDRDIFIQNDDSVSMVSGDKPRIIRRSRGYAPQPLVVSSKGPPILAVGGMLKNTVCMLKDKTAILSQHIGDLENVESYDIFQKTIHHLQSVFETAPELIVHDLHPGYLSTTWAEEQDIPKLAVQHHWAHLASVMVENNVSAPTIGITMDGTGYGMDGTIWGGEILVGDFTGFTRKAHFEPVPLPGGDTAIKAPWRTALSYSRHAFGSHIPDLPVFASQASAPVLEMLEANINCPRTSSCGRLFDAVAVLCGEKPTIRYEGQAAIEFMQKVDGYLPRPFNYIIEDQGDKHVWTIAPIIQSMVKAIQSGESPPRLSGRFHKTLIELFHETVLIIRRETGINTVALSGGVFQNHVLFEGLILRLTKSGCDVLTHSLVPANDGGLSLGQAMIGREYLNTK